jgi:hypothetical protein
MARGEIRPVFNDPSLGLYIVSRKDGPRRAS